MFATINYILGAISLLYFMFYALNAGLTNTFTFAWLIFAIMCIVCGFMSNTIISVWKKLNIGMKIGCVSMVTIIILIVIISLCVVIFTGRKAPKKDADYVIVLGGQVRGKAPSYNLSKRLDKAYEYLKNNKNTKVIVSGGQGRGEDITEAEAMETYLVNKGIAKERIIKEDKSKNTDENIQFSKQYIDEKKDRVVIVTSNFHVYRGIRIAKKQGLKNIEGLGSDIMWYTVPNLYLRESIAVIKYTLCRQI